MDSEHELLVFKRVKSALNRIRSTDAMDVKSTGPLANALGQLGCFPYAEIPCDSYPLDCKFSIAGKPAGTFEKPDVDLILKESTASPFGKGEMTVMDPAYRNGKEVTAQNMEIMTDRSYGYFTRSSEDEISAAMFVGKTVKFKFYKLAVYEEGGHFDWHMDTTHSDQHHATLLLALNTSWEGGDLKLRRNGVETSVDLHPKPDLDGKGINLQAVAFYTDTEHKVEPVTKGIRIVLQYDVEVVGWVAGTSKHGDEIKVKVKGDDDGDDDDDDESKNEDEAGDHDEDPDEELFENVNSISNKRKRYEKFSDSLSVEDAIVTKVTDIIAKLLANEREEVAFAMQHLYRKSSILPEYLKGADAQLYRALVSRFDVTLQPVVLKATTDFEGLHESYLAIPWTSKPPAESTGSDDLEEEEEEEDDDLYVDVYYDRTSKSSRKAFHLPMLSAIMELSHQHYVEHTGNEAQPGDKKYFGGGMFVRQRKVA